MKNGLQLGLQTSENFKKVAKLRLPVFDRAFNLHNFVKDETKNREALQNLLSKKDLSQVQSGQKIADPLFHTFDDLMQFKGSEECL